MIESGNGHAMIALHVAAFTSVGDGAHEDRFEGAKVVAWVSLGSFLFEVISEVGQIKDSGRKVSDLFAPLVSHVACHAEGFEIDLGTENRGPNIKKDSVFESRDALGIDQEVGIRSRTGGGAIEVGVFMHNVLTDANMNGDRNSQSVTGSENAMFSVRELLGFDHPSDGFAQAQGVAIALSRGVIESGGFVPESELAVFDISRDAFASLSDHGKFKIVNRSGSIQSQMSQQATLHEIDQQLTIALPQHMSSAAKQNGPLRLGCLNDPLGEQIDRFVVKIGRRRSGLDEHFLELEIVSALHERENFELTAIELGERHQ